MTWTIGKEYTFAASHQLCGLPAEHQCSRLHGHNYRVVVELTAGRLDGTGMVKDFGELKPLRRFIDDTLDHRHLNEVVDDNPTAENIARLLWHVARDVVGPLVTSVTVWETPTAWATYNPR